MNQAVIFNIEEAVKNSLFNVFQEPIKFILENEVEAFENNSIIPHIFVTQKMTGFREEYRSYTAMDGFKPTEDMEVAGLSDFDESYNKEFRTQIWTNSFVISKQAQEDGQTNDVTRKALTFIKSYGRTKELYAVNFIGAALGTVTTFEGKKLNGTSYDTVDGSIDGTKRQYFHNEHKGVKIKGASQVTQSNKFYTTLNFNSSDAGLEEKVLDVIGQVETAMKLYKDDKGNITPVRPTKIIMPTNYRLRTALETGLKSRYGSPMAGNGVNLKYGAFELVESEYLADVPGFEASDFSIILISPERNREGLGFVWHNRLGLEVRSYMDQRTQANIWEGRSRFGAGCADFRAAAYINFGGTQTTNATLITPKATEIKNIKVVNTVLDPVNTKAVVEAAAE